MTTKGVTNSNGNTPFSAAYGTVRDYSHFFNALVPRQKTSIAPRVIVPLVDTVLLLKGKPQRWLHSSASNEATEKLHVDKESIHSAFRQSALANPNNLAKLVSIIRRQNGTYEVLDAEGTAEFMKAIETSKGLSAVAVQKYVHSRGGDRAIYRNVYDYPPTAPGPTLTTTRYSEYLSPEASNTRSEMAPVRSYQDAINHTLDEYTRRVAVQLEGALRCRVTYLALDYIMDEKEVCYLLWPSEFRAVEVRKDGTPIIPTETSLPYVSSDSSSSSTSSEPSPPTNDAPDWVREKARIFEEEQARDRQLQNEYNSIVDQTVGTGERGNILITDADPYGVMTAVQTLTQAGFAVTVVNDGPKALALTRTTTFDCLLLARDLPSLSGLEVTKILRQREASLQATRPGATGSAAYHLPIVAFTAATEPDDLRLYMEAGMDGCVSKPVDTTALLNTMAAAVPVPTYPTRNNNNNTTTTNTKIKSKAGSNNGSSSSTTTLNNTNQDVHLGEPSSVQLPQISTKSNKPQQQSSSRAYQTGVASSSSSSSSTPFPSTGPVQAWNSAPNTPAHDNFSAHRFPESSMLEDHNASQGHMDEQQLQMLQAGTTGIRGARAMAQARRGNETTKPSNSKSASPPRTTTVRRRSTGGGTTVQGGPVAVDANGQIHMPSGAAIPGIAPPVSGVRQGGRVADGVMPPVTTTLPVTEDEDGSHLGIFQLDAETALPYCVMGKKRPGVPLFHFVVIGDIFDTYEQYQIMFRKIVTKLPGLRVLLFNYPGQAFTEWRKDIVLNNEYCAGVLQALLTYLGPGGTREFDLDGDKAPFHLMGIGNGGAIANYFAAAYHGSHPNMRSLVNVNGFAHVDAHLAGVMHDCMNVFACSPVSRPDLPVYFFARFLFSPQYLQKVGAPLALNLYTAVSNPITLQGRIALCQGALSHVDCRHALESLTLPMIIVASSKDGLVKPSHVAVMVESRGGEVRSIKRALAERARAVVIWLRCGHEVLQEARKPMVNLIEQLATGYHERNDVAFLPLVPDDVAGEGMSKGLQAAEEAKSRAATMAAQTSALQAMNMSSAAAALASDPLKPVPGNKAPQQLFEDKFLDNVVTTMRGTGPRGNYAVNPLDNAVNNGQSKGPQVQTSDIPDALEMEMDIPPEVLKFGQAGNNLRRKSANGRLSLLGSMEPVELTEAQRKELETKKAAEAKVMKKKLILDPELVAFERREKEFADAKARGSIASYATGDVKEYMSWRIRRNKKRLMRIEACAVTIQRAWRSYLARTLVSRMRQQRAALDVQRWWRGCLARKAAKIVKREIWAARVVQRCWRGSQGRNVAWRMKAERKAASIIQRNWRGYRARKFVFLVRDLRRSAAVKIQSAWRRFLGQRETWKKRDLRNAAINVQRVWRGFLGRARAAKERDRYLFSKSQAQGIEFGRQMLMEHKLHGTKLQSEVSLLTKEKLATEEKIETLLAEIATFEQGVRALEKEMVDLSRAEAEAAGTLDEEAKIELRENKIRLDREFAAMLVKIADRRETLASLEAKLQTIDRARIAKKEELKDLERKLVVLLEQQQQELQAIRMRQERRSENVIEDAVTAVTAALKDQDPGQPGQKYLLNNGTVNNGNGPMLLADGTVSSNTLGRSLAGPGGGTMVGGNGGNGGAMIPHQQQQPIVHGGPTPQQRAEAQALMASTETMMKFGFMSMSLTYFSSLNMVRAMRQMGTANTVLASNPMLALIGQMGAAATGGGNPASVALAATGGLNSLGGGGLPMLGNGGPPQLALTTGTIGSATLPGHLGIAQTSSVGAANLAASLGGTSATYLPALKPGQLPGQETPELSLWTVGDVSNWLDTLALGQYRDAFADAAIDGGFLSELTDDDLRNTLGIEHALHRKKILSSILKLRQAEEDRKAAKILNTMPMGSTGGGSNAMMMGGTLGGGGIVPNLTMTGGSKPGTANPAVANNGRVSGFATSNQLQLDAAESAAADKVANRDAGVLKLDELISWVRHNKGKLLSEALAAIPDGKFDPSLLKAAFLPGYGTQYIDMLNGPAFHINKADDKGNTLLLVAAQNGRQKLAQLLIRKGANPNHQNVQGNTAMHYAMAYKFHELAAWLADPEKGGGNDEIQNIHGMGPYDGLAPE